MLSVHNDFGKEYQFQGKTIVYKPELERLSTGEAWEDPSSNWDYKLVVYTGGAYPKVVYQRKYIPTFDIYDRESDSWHDLYLIREENGNIKAVYATGGYVIAGITGWNKVISCPKKIRELLEA